MAKRYGSTSVKSKWVKTKWLIRNAALRKYVPDTRLFHSGSLRSMTKRYRMIYFKPTSGGGGNGISKIVRTGSHSYRIQNNKGTFRVSSVGSLHRKLRRLAGHRSYLLQRGIYLRKTKGRPFDLRVMLQKSNSGSWIHSATFSKIGKPGKVATNYNQGGRIGFLEGTLLGAGFSRSRIREASEKLRVMGRRTGKCFDRHARGFRELGLDVAIDKKGRFWILEVNTRPQFYPLRNKDKGMYRRIVRISRQYGRTR